MTDEKRTLAEFLGLAGQLGATLDLTTIFSTGCRAAVELLGVSHSGLVLFTENPVQGTVQAEYPPLGTIGTVIPISGVPAEERLIASRQPLIIPDVASYDGLGAVRTILLDLGVSSILVVPIVNNDNVLGSFSLDSIGQPRAFSQVDIDLALALAAQLAVAIDNATIFSAIRLRNRQLEGLYRSILEISQILDQEPLVRAIERGAAAVLGSGSATFHECALTASRDVISPTADPQILTAVQSMLTTGHPASSDPQGITALVRSNDRLLAVIRWHSTNGSTVTTDDIELLSHFCEHAAAALANANLVVELELLAAASSAIANADCLDTALHTLAERFVHLLRHSFCRILLVKPESTSLRVQAAYPIPRAGADLHWTPQLSHVLPLSDFPEFAAPGTHEIPSVIRSDADPARLAALTSGLGLATPLRSLMLVPMTWGPQLLGIVEIGELRTENRSPMTDTEARRAVALARQLGALIERLRQLETTEKRKRLLGTLDDTLRTLRSQHHPVKLQQDVVRLASELCSALGAALVDVHTSTTAGRNICAHHETHGFNWTDPPINALVDSVTMEVVRTTRTATLFAPEPSTAPTRGPAGGLTLTAVPLAHTGALSNVLVVAQHTETALPHIETDILERFASAAGITIGTSRLMTREQRSLERLTILHHVSDYIQGAHELDKILHVVLTGITAGYGLGFNRAALLLVDPDGGHLSGTMAIGHLTAKAALAAWTDNQARGLHNFKAYLRLLEAGRPTPTPLDSRVREIRVEIGTEHGGELLAACCNTSEGVVVYRDQDDVTRLNPAFVRVFEPALPFALVPLCVRDQHLGVLVVDNKFTASPITDEDCEDLGTFANSAAIAIDNVRLYSRTNDLLAAVVASRRAAAIVASMTALGQEANTLESIAVGTRDVVGCDAVVLYVYQPDRQTLDHPPVMCGVRYPDRASALQEVPSTSLVYEMVRRTDPYIVPDVERDPIFRSSRFARDEAIESLVALPLRIGNEAVGVMFVNYRSRHSISPSELEDVKLFGNQAAVAIRNVQLFDDVQKRTAHLEAVHTAATVIGRRIGVDVSEILPLIAEQTVTCLTANSPRDDVFCSITLYDPDRSALRFAAAYPETFAVAVRTRVGEELVIAGPARAPRIGIIGRAALSLELERLDDPTRDDDYIDTDSRVRSEMARPLLDNGRLLGVMSVESTGVRAFTRSDEATLRALAELAVLALANAAAYDEGRRTQARVARVTAVALAGMSASAWGHEVVSTAQSIDNFVKNIRTAHALGDVLIRREAHERALRGIEEQVKCLLNKPFLPPLTPDERGEVYVLRLVRERRCQLMDRQEALRNITVAVVAPPGAEDWRVRGRPEWVVTALDQLIMNAAKELQAKAEGDRLITLTVRRVGSDVEIVVADNGRGIPPEIRRQLFLGRVEKGEADTHSGTGTGLLIATTVVETYGGRLYIDDRFTDGTAMVMQWSLLE